MPRVKSFTPEWLMRPNPGHQMFQPSATNVKTPASLQDTGKRKTIATRGSEVFVAVGTEIRWADLALLKDPEDYASYRTLKVSVPLPITQLVVSPNEDYLAVSTSHTVHVVILPDPKLLDSEDTSPIKTKTFQIGPTAHVREESPVASVLWHPLGYHGHCLITITREGVVRLWEVNRTDRMSFSNAALSIDLKKLANAESDQDNLDASAYGAPKGFSPDSFELEVSSACFGDFPDQEGVHGWAPMTLWIAMVEGDVYALCPLLPSRWQLQASEGLPTVLQTLATSINADYIDPEEDSDATPEEKETSSRQLKWLYDILYAEPFEEQLPSGDTVHIFDRPRNVPACPLLQGPFQINQSEDEYFELSDIVVFSLKTFSEGEEDDLLEGLPAAVICLLTDTSRVHVCLDLVGIVGRWLPSEKRTTFDTSEHELNLVETVVLSDNSTSSFNQSITPDVHTDFSFFVSNSNGTYYVSLEPWIRKLEEELADPHSERTDFRLGRLLDSAATQAELCMQRPSRAVATKDSQDKKVEEVISCVVIEDGNVGYLVLTSIDNQPQAVILDAPDSVLVPEVSPSGTPEASGVLALTQSRELFAPPREFYDSLQFVQAKDHLIPQRHRAPSKEEIRLSPANLDILMNAHKALSADTHKLQTAVSDLFVRCERLRDEFRDQVVRISQLANQIDGATGADEGEPGSINAKIEERLEKVTSRQEAINNRYESIRRKMASLGGNNLSDKEQALQETLQTIERSIDSKAQTLSGDADGSEDPAWKRMEKVKKDMREYREQVDTLTRKKWYGEQELDQKRGEWKVPSHSRKMEEQQVQQLLDRETALVDAAAERLRTLGITMPAEG